PEEHVIFMAQLEAAIRRGRGEGPTKEAPLTRVDVLEKGSEDTRQWLHRVDAFARSMEASTYRAATIDKTDLWATLNDPEAKIDLRAAAARVLVRVDPTARVRVDEAIATIHDKKDAKRVRIAALEEADEAAELIGEFQDASHS